MHTHETFMYVLVYGLSSRVYPGVINQNQEESFSFVSIYESYVVLFGGGGIAIKSHVFHFLDDLRESNAEFITIFPGDLQIACQKINEFINQQPEKDKKAMQEAIDRKIKIINENNQEKTTELDAIIAPIRERFFGKNIKFIYTGGAPTAPIIFNTIRAVTGADVINTYGSTEMVLITSSKPNAVAGCLGPPLPLRMIKLVSIPKLKYTVNDVINGRTIPRGEVDN